MKLTRFLKGITGWIALSFALPAFAEIEWSGFGSAYYAQTFNSNLLGPKFTDTNPTFGPFSLIGLNLATNLNPDLRVATQLVASSTSTSGAWNLTAKWATLIWQPTSDWAIKFGRQLYPAFIGSEFADVGYLFPYRKIPNSVYLLVPFTGFDGASVARSWDFGFAKLTPAVFAGRGNFDNLNSATAIVDADSYNIVGTSITLEGNGFDLHALYSRSTSKLKYIVNGVTAVDTDHETVQTVTLGYRFEKYNFVSWGEFAYLYDTGNTVIPANPTLGIPGGKYLGNAKGAYVLGGYHIGKWLPRYTFAINDTRIGFVDGKTAFHTLGLNYQMNSQATIKLEYELAVVADGRHASLYTPAPGTSDKTGSSVYLGVDFIF